MAFFQNPPQLTNSYHADRTLKSFLSRHLTPDALADIEPSLEEMGELAVGPLRQLSLDHRRAEPELIHYDPWGRRIDEIRVTPAWKEFARLAAEKGLVATAYERRHGAMSRLHQFALAYLFDPPTHTYNCPLAMTDGSACVLSVHGSEALRERALPHLTSRDPAQMWTAGQWMTERTGGSDVGASETRAVKTPQGWRLYGTKWFTSATTSEIALTLARPEGNPEGGRGLALFYVEQRLADGGRNHIQVNRLKEKLGTRMLPTAELDLLGAFATPVKGLEHGIRHIAPMLNITRTWNSVCAVASMSHGVALARDYAQRRRAFGSPLADKPLHLSTLAQQQAEFEGAFVLTFEMIRLLGKSECGEATEAEEAALRLLHPLAKLVTGKQVVAAASETLESFGGAGYVEDTGLPRILRDSQVLPIWEGTTNVLSLDCLRAIAREQALRPTLDLLTAAARSVRAPQLKAPAEVALRAAERAATWLQETRSQGQPAVEAGARHFALTLGRALALAWLCQHADHQLAHSGDARSAWAARQFAANGVDCLERGTLALEEARALALDTD